MGEKSWVEVKNPNQLRGIRSFDQLKVLGKNQES